MDALFCTQLSRGNYLVKTWLMLSWRLLAFTRIVVTFQCSKEEGEWLTAAAN